jgi:hypothetical protein
MSARPTGSWFSLVFFVAVTVLGTTPCPAQLQTTLQGKLEREGPNHQRYPASEVEVTIRDSATNIRSDPSYTGHDGMYYVARVTPAVYFLEIWIPGSSAPLVYRIQALAQPFTDVAPILVP